MNCQADTCSCWYSSHHNNNSNTSSLSIQQQQQNNNNVSKHTIQQRCGNRTDGGIYVVDSDHIDTFRNDYLHRLKTCPFISI